MGIFGSGGTTNATISGGARLVSNGSLSAGGSDASNVTLNVTGGRVESDGTISLERGATTTVSSAGVIEGQNVVLGSSGGTTITTVTGVGSLLKVAGHADRRPNRDQLAPHFGGGRSRIDRGDRHRRARRRERRRGR